MRTYAAIVIAMTILALGPAVRAQSGSSVSGFQGNYSLSGSGTTSCNGLPGTTCTTKQATTVNNISFFPTGFLQWFDNTDIVMYSANNLEVFPCDLGGTITSTFVGNGSSSGNPGLLNIDVAGGTFTYFPEPLGNELLTTRSSACGPGGSRSVLLGLFPLSNWPLKFPLPPFVEPLILNNLSFLGDGIGLKPIPWTFSFKLTPLYTDDDDCKQPGGSSIGCQNQSLGEDVPIVGTGFNLHYEGDRAPGAGANSVARADASMIGGWTLSVHHAIDRATNTLFLGDGSQRNGYQLGTPVFFNGNFLFTSKNGSEVYVFSGSTGQHLQTLRPLTGALLYQLGYDSAGKLVTVTDATGNVTKIQRDSSEHPTAIISPYGQSTTLKVDSHGFLSQVTDPFGKSATFVNTSTGLLTSRTDENGNIFDYTYDSQGRLAKDADPLGGFIALTHTNATSGFGWTVGQTTSMGRKSSYQTTLSVPWVQTSTSTFSKHHTNTWPNGLQATETKTQRGSQISESVTLPDGTSSSDTLSPDPIWSIQVPVVTSETFTQGNLTMNISGSRTASLGTAGNPFSLVTRTDKATINGRTYTSAFTGSKRTWVNTSPVGRTLTVGLDSLERIASTQIEGLLASDFAYDSRGRLSTVIQGTRKTTLTYDSDGRLATATDPVGLKNSFSYDPDGRLLSTTLADGRIIDYKYDANGNRTAVIPPGKSAHNFDYTAVNQMSEYLPPSVPGTGSTTYSYNTDMDITKITRPDLRTISFDYDSAGRLSSVITPSETVDYTYSSTTGNVTGASITSGEALAYSYDGPLPTSTSWTGTINGSLSLAYNDNFWVTSRSIDSGNTIAFSYDNDGLVTKAGVLTLNRSSQDSLITGTTLGLATDSRSYNSFGELTGYTASYNGGHLYSVTYTRDADGRVSGKTEIIGGTTNTFVYSYDLAGRLIGVTENAKGVSSYSYDTNSNRTKATTTSGTVTGTYDAQDRLLTYGTASYTYTANGELASQKVSTQTTTYSYDVLGNLIAATLPNGTKITYVIDAHNHRVGKKVNGVLQTGFLFDGNQVVAQLNGSNVIVSQFIYATGSTAPDYMVQGAVTYRIFSDQLGSPRLVVNTSTGAIAERIDYDEFGNVINDTKPGFQPFGFAGGLYDQDTKLVRFGARDYNPSIGRWTAKDPILFNGGDTNLYGYVFNDPVNLLDPSGHFWQEIWDWIHGVFGKEPPGVGEAGQLLSPEGAEAAGGLVKSLQEQRARECLDETGDAEVYYRIMGLSTKDWLKEGGRTCPCK